jgi:hypothetical protein
MKKADVDGVTRMVRKEFEIVGGDFDRETKEDAWIRNA